MNEKHYRKLSGVESVYIRDDDIIITGHLQDSDDPEHNCDDIGCSSREHILLRGQFRFVQKGYREGSQETADAPVPCRERPTCTWSENEDGVWECSKCGLMWILEDGNPAENDMEYCPGCGRYIAEEKRYEGDGEDD